VRIRAIRVIVLAAAAFVVGRHEAFAQLQITAGPDVNISFGFLGQFQGDWISNPDGSHTQNLFVRRLRLISGGQVAPHVTFFFDTDAPNLGKTLPTGKNVNGPMILQDAYGEFTANDAFAIEAGFFYVPFSRNGLQGAAALLPIDFGPNTFTSSGPTQSSAGRDTGFQARGFLLDKHLEYRAGVFQGARNAASTNGLRYAGRAQYEVFDTETDFFYAGTSLGTKKILAIGAGFDAEDQYRAYAADAFLDLPAGPGAFTGQFDYNRFDGSTTFVTLPKQNDYLVEAGYFIKAAKITPVLQLSNRDIIGVSNGDELRWSIGLNYYWAGQNANVKGAYTRIHPGAAPDQNEFTVQLQLFYFRSRP
jgi:hypothetical protein